MPVQTDGKEFIVWVDLETTGLDPVAHVLLELAMVVTDTELNPVGEAVSIVISQPPEKLALMDALVHKMHTESGLLGAVRGSKDSLVTAESKALEYLRHVGVEPKYPLLGGSSVHFDRNFLYRHLRALHNNLHYRNIDVSSFKEAARLWRPEVYELRPAKKEGHRAMEDVLESIEELRHYRRALIAT